MVREVFARPRLRPHIITLANEKGGVGKSTLAFHTCLALAERGHRVAAIDLDRRQQTLGRALASRDGTARRLGVALPSVSHVVLEQQSGGLLHQEISRIGWDCEFVVIDAPGHDNPVARRAIAMADTLVTPVNPSFVDLEPLGRFDPVTLRFREPGYFARMISELNDERMAIRAPQLDWIVAPNRLPRAASHSHQQFIAALGQLSERAIFRLSRGLGESVAYRELMQLGLTQLDLKRLPQFGKARARHRGEILSLLSDLDLPERTAENHALIF